MYTAYAYNAECTLPNFHALCAFKELILFEYTFAWLYKFIILIIYISPLNYKDKTE